MTQKEEITVKDLSKTPLTSEEEEVVFPFPILHLVQFFLSLCRKRKDTSHEKNERCVSLTE